MKRFAALVAAVSIGSSALAFAADPAPVPPSQAKPAAGQPAKPQPAAEKPHIDIVFCIDRSHSMDQVIETAKQKVWAIVNQVARAEPAPVLRIGLIGYGQGEQILHQLDLSDDLDEVYRQLVTYTADSSTGDEFVGHALHVATGQMKWSQGKQVLKLIYVVGNETARQGPAHLDYTKTAPAAIQKGIQVNAIYCGTYDYETAPPTWREMAKLADGQYLEIAATGGAVVVATPFDAELDGLNEKLNATYIAYGGRGGEGAENQVAQDAAAAGLGGAVAADRAVAKASRQYRNAKWDLVDALAEADFDWSKLPDDDLPEVMRQMSPDERKAYVEQKAKERAEVQKEIQAVAAKRAKHIEEESKKQGLDDNAALDAAVRESLTEQAKEKGFRFEK